MTGRIGAGDPKYDRVIRKQFNKRFRAQPHHVRLIGSTDDAIAAVTEAVSEEQRIVATSGGHCLEGRIAEEQQVR